jgi:hypothetical protein
MLPERADGWKIEGEGQIDLLYHGAPADTRREKEAQRIGTAMSAHQQRNLRQLEGRNVHISLSDGSRYDDVALVSARARTLWIFTGGEDTFLPVDQVIDVWEAESLRSAA